MRGLKKFLTRVISVNLKTGRDKDRYQWLLTPIQAFKWFIDQGGQWNSNWENRVTRVIPKTEVPFSPFVTAPFTQAPELMMIGKEDEMPLISHEVQLVVLIGSNAKKSFMK